MDFVLNDKTVERVLVGEDIDSDEEEERLFVKSMIN